MEKTPIDYSTHVPEQFIQSNGALSRVLAERVRNKRLLSRAKLLSSALGDRAAPPMIVDGQWSAFQMHRVRGQAAQRREDIRMIMLERTGYTPESHALKMKIEEAKRRFEVFLPTKKKEE